MLSIYMKEMRQYFHSMTGYIFLTILTFISGFLFTSGNLLSQNGDIRIFFSSLFNVLIFLIPILTMRQFSEEQKLKTRQLLFTLPLTLQSIVLGKFLATLTVVLTGLAVSLLYPLMLAWYGSVSTLVTLGNYTAVILMISAVTALGLFVSTLTENQIISAVATYGIILIIRLSDSLAPTLSHPLIKKALTVFSLKGNYIEFTYGIFNPAGILYFLSFTVLFLILSMVSLESRRQ